MVRFYKRAAEAVKFTWDHLRDPSSQTYYPEAQRKSRIGVCLDNFRWMLKHYEINHFYYVYGFDRKEGVNQDDYMSYAMFRNMRNRANLLARIGRYRSNYVCLLRDKFVFGMYLKSLGFPTPKILAICDEGSVAWLDTRTTEPLEDLCKRDGLDGFVKELMGECADGVYSIKVENGKVLLAGHEVSPEELRAVVKGKCIIQERIYQHQRMNELYPHSVNTIRLVTAIRNGEACALSAIIRMGVNGEHRDNWATGGILAGVDLETGRLGSEGIFKPGYGGRVMRHPDTGVDFSSFVVPYFTTAVEMATQLHNFLYGIHSIGWDIAVTNTGPVFIEGNDNWEVSMLQIYDQSFKKKFIATLSV